MKFIALEIELSHLELKLQPSGLKIIDTNDRAFVCIAHSDLPQLLQILQLIQAQEPKP